MNFPSKIKEPSRKIKNFLITENKSDILYLYLIGLGPFHCLPGVPGVKEERFEDGMTVKHCALSLVGEPIMYPEINKFLKLLHECKISSFLVTNAQFPAEIRWVVSPVKMMLLESVLD